MALMPISLFGCICLRLLYWYRDVLGIELTDRRKMKGIRKGCFALLLKTYVWKKEDGNAELQLTLLLSHKQK